MAAVGSNPAPREGVGVMIVGRGRGLDAVERTLQERHYTVVRASSAAAPRRLDRGVVVVGNVTALSEWDPARRMRVKVLAIDTAQHLERWVEARPEGKQSDFVRVVNDLEREDPDRWALTEIAVRVERLCASSRSGDAVQPGSVEELHDPTTGRLDAKRVAAFLNIPLRALAEAMGRNYTTVHKTPTAEALQDALGPIVRIVDLLMRQGKSKEEVRAWLRAPHAELEERAPWSLVAGGRAEVVRDLLLASYMGLPT